MDITKLDFSYLSDIVPYDGDKRDGLSTIDIDAEIEALSLDMAKLDTSSIKFDKWDYIVAFALGLLEVAGDFMFSDHNVKNSIANQMQDKNTPLGEAFEKIHKLLDHEGQPMDYQGIGFAGDNHRGNTFCHDLLMFPLSIYMLTKGKFIDGVYRGGTYEVVTTALNQYGKEYASLNFGESLIAYFTHMIADFFSTKSLPIPGFSILTHSPNREIRLLAKRLYANGLNLRNLVMQGIPVATVELITWIYTELRHKDSEYTKEQVIAKKDTMLLLSHGIATAVNAGKVIINVLIAPTAAKKVKALTSINLPMVIRTVTLVWSAVSREIKKNNDRKALIYSSVLKTELEIEKTLILLEECVYYTSEISRLIVEAKQEFDETNERRIDTLNSENAELRSLLEELKTTNGDDNDE